nr:TSUP family transporter [archaeon]
QLVLFFASLSGVVVHSLLGHPDFVQAGLLAVGSFFGGLLGARISLRVRERYLQILVTAVLLIVAGKLFLDSFSGNSIFFGF